MTISNTDNKLRLNGDATTTTFPFSFPLIESDYGDLFVYKIDIDPITSEETSTLLTIDTDYTITATKDINNRITGGTINTLFTPTSDQAIFAIRTEALTQDTELQINQRFPEKVIENTLDKIIAIEQQQKEKLDRVFALNQFTTTTINNVENPVDRRALVWEDNLDGSFNIIPSTYDPDAYTAEAEAQVIIATTQAGIATTQAGLASGYATQSAGYRDESEGFKDEAEAAAASINGDPLWSATKTYDKGNIANVIVSDIPYKYYNLTGTNTATSPESDATNWALWTDKDRVKQDGSNATFSNLSAPARKVVSNNAMPSSSYTDLTLGVTGTIYTAPENGYVCFCSFATAAGGVVALITNGNGIKTTCTAGDGGNPYVRCFLPIAKGNQFRAEYFSIDNLQPGFEFRFYYNNGDI